MPRNRPSPQDPSSEAMRRALEAEERAREAIEGCRQQAEELHVRAREDARRIRQRADRRIARVQDRCETLLQGRLKGRLTELQEGAPPAAAGSPEDRTALEEAVNELVERLTSPEDTEGP